MAVLVDIHQEDSADADSPHQARDSPSSSEAAEAPCRPWGEELYFPDQDRKPPKFDSFCTAGSKSGVVRCGAMSMGGRHRGTWKKENQDQYTMQAREGWMPAGGPLLLYV